MSTQTQTLLHLTSSLFGSEGASSQLAGRYAALWQKRNPQGRIIRRDLAADPLPHLDGERFTAFITPSDQRTPQQQVIAAESDALIAELEQADTVLLGVPMYNFAVPSTLKSWMDHVARSGRTFRYTENGPEGLLKGKQAVVFFTRGGKYAGTAADTQSGFVRQFFGFLGITDVQTIYAEGLAYGADAKNTSMSDAQTTASQLLAQPQAA